MNGETGTSNYTADLAGLVPLPSPDDLNAELTSPSSAWMLAEFGAPGPLGQECADPYPHFAKQIITANVGPFRCTGHKAAILSLQHIFRQVEIAGRTDLLTVKTDGMLCVRAIRGYAGRYSNHSWGCAIDLRFGDEGVPLGEAQAQAGVLALYPFFHHAGWYWGGGYHGRPDSMHMEASVELITTWRKLGIA